MVLMAALSRALAARQLRQAWAHPSGFRRSGPKLPKGSAAEHPKHHLHPGGTRAGMLRRGMSGCCGKGGKTARGAAMDGGQAGWGPPAQSVP